MGFATEALPFVSQTDLQNLYLAGTFRDAVTIQVIDIGGSPHDSVEAVIADDSGNILGSCWTCDIENLAEFAEADKANNSGRANPNFAVVFNTLAEMRAIREGITRTQEEWKKPKPSAQIIQFTPNDRTVAKPN